MNYLTYKLWLAPFNDLAGFWKERQETETTKFDDLIDDALIITRDKKHVLLKEKISVD